MRNKGTFVGNLMKLNVVPFLLKTPHDEKLDVVLLLTMIFQIEEVSTMTIFSIFVYNYFCSVIDALFHSC